MGLDKPLRVIHLPQSPITSPPAARAQEAPDRRSYIPGSSGNDMGVVNIKILAWFRGSATNSTYSILELEDFVVFFLGDSILGF